MVNLMQVDDGGGRGRVIAMTYPPNSEKSKKTKVKAEPVVTGLVTQRKKGWGTKFKESMLGERGYEGIIETLITDLLAGAIKGLISDIVTGASNAVNDGVNRVLYPGSQSRSGRHYTNYGGVTRRYQPERGYGAIDPRARAEHDFKQIVLANRGDAEDVLDGLRKIIDEYGIADVGDLYDLLGITAEPVDKNWGWNDLTSAKIVLVRGGFMLSLPRTQPLDKR